MNIKVCSILFDVIVSILIVIGFWVGVRMGRVDQFAKDGGVVLSCLHNNKLNHLDTALSCMVDGLEEVKP